MGGGNCLSSVHLLTYDINNYPLFVNDLLKMSLKWILNDFVILCIEVFSKYLWVYGDLLGSLAPCKLVHQLNNAVII